MTAETPREDQRAQDLAADDREPSLASGEAQTAGKRPADPATAAAPGAEPARRGGRGTLLVAIFALLVALSAVGAAAWLWQLQVRTEQDLRAQLTATRDALKGALAAVESSVDAARSQSGDLDGVRARMSGLDGAQSALQASVDRLSSDVEAARRELRQLELAVEGAGGLISSAGASWTIAEAEYLLQTANVALQLARDPDAALAALRAADERLSALGNPRLTPVRDRLASEIAAVRAMPRPDLAGVAFTLGGLASRVELLELVDGPAEEYGEPAELPPEDASGWSRALAAVSSALSNMVSFRRDEEFQPLLAPEERFFLYRNLELQLDAARIAALRGDPVNFRESLVAARRLLKERFDTESSGVLSALETLSELESVDVRPEIPDISRSLALLRQVDLGDG